MTLIDRRWRDGVRGERRDGGMERGDWKCMCSYRLGLDYHSVCHSKRLRRGEREKRDRQTDRQTQTVKKQGKYSIFQKKKALCVTEDRESREGGGEREGGGGIANDGRKSYSSHSIARIMRISCFSSIFINTI